VAETAKRATAIGGNIKIFCFDKEGITTCGKAEGVLTKQTLEEMVDAVKSEVVNGLR
jgi:CRISPR-associated protein Csa2